MLTIFVAKVSIADFYEKDFMTLDFKKYYHKEIQKVGTSCLPWKVHYQFWNWYQVHTWAKLENPWNQKNLFVLQNHNNRWNISN